MGKQLLADAFHQVQHYYLETLREKITISTKTCQAARLCIECNTEISLFIVMISERALEPLADYVQRLQG